MGTLLAERFEILKEIGRGSRGIVYLASDHQQKDREVALKVIPFFSPNNVVGTSDEFQNEFSILSRLRNPSLAELYEFGFDPARNSYFLAEEYFAGEPLSRWSGRLSFQRLAEITARLCQVLQFLHQEGIFHGDLKPNNILIQEKQETIKLVDFGLAGRFDQTSSPHEGVDGQEGSASGTIPYMAPELFLGAPVDGRSDLYSLGVTLYELVNGHPPFEGSLIPSLVEKQLFEMPMNPIPEGSSMPKEFGFLILKLLNKDPADRFEEANDVIRALNLQFHFNFPLGPEKAVLSPERARELGQKNVERLYEWAVRFYKTREDPESRRLLAEIYYRQGKWEEAEGLLQGLSDPRVRLLLLQIGLKKGSFEWVVKEGARLLQELPKGNLPKGSSQGSLLNTIGEALYLLGRYDESERAFNDALAGYEQTKDKGSRASLLNNLGNLRIRDGKWEAAKQFYEQSLSLCRERGDFQNEGLSLMSLGYVFHLREKYDAAIPYYQQSEAIFEAIGYRPGAAKVKSNLANLFIAVGSLEKGEEKLRQSEEIARETGDRFLVAYTRLLAGDLLKKKEKPLEALAAYREGKKLFGELRSPDQEDLADRNITELLEKMGPDSGRDAQEVLSPPHEYEPTLPFMKRVLAINRRISLLTDFDEILEAIIEAMIELTGAERGYLILRENEKNVVKVTKNLEGEASEVCGKKFSGSLVDRVLKSGEPVITLDAMNDERFSLSLSVHKLKLRSIVCVPLRVKEDVIGAIYLDNRLQRGAFSEKTIDLLQAFVDQTAIAISNARAIDGLKKSTAALRKSHDALQLSQQEIEALNRQLKDALSLKEVELSQAKSSLASQQAALELKYRYDEIVGRSAPMLEVLRLLDRVIESDVSVFIFGESGTGKELMARAIHFNGPRAKEPFIPVNCSAIPETLLEAELFGYVNGAFTGANRDRKGLFEMATGGTLFLDEIGDMPPVMQAKLLRVLEERQVRPIGSEKMLPIDVRIVSASSHDLKDLIREKQFREDLFFRIQGIRIALPPLRERKEDLPLLIDAILARFAKERGTKRKTLTRSSYALLAGYPWPGNIRELENTVFNACLLSKGVKIVPEDFRQKDELFLKEHLVSEENGGMTLRDSTASFQKGMIAKILLECHGNITQAAKKLHVARPYLSYLVKKYRLKTE